ncbi:uncharacterized protein LOC143689771 isoform X2 [Tamandua tetradactyla]|uniref:uncharacterized protein LOC143689771 isoform X2 n=1 Tax=Tamandua tetradactyla TaxID=48850 RepID=UPI00405469AE
MAQTGKPVVGDEFLKNFLPNFEMDDDMKMLLELLATDEEGAAPRNREPQATFPAPDLLKNPNLKPGNQEEEKKSSPYAREHDGQSKSKRERLRRTNCHRASRKEEIVSNMLQSRR